MTQTPTKQKKVKPTPAVVTSGPIKKLSLNEFRAWLSGVEEMQSDDWTPDHTQWRRIRAKIDEIVEGRGGGNFSTSSSDVNDEPMPRALRTAGASSLTPTAMQTPLSTLPPPTFMNTSDLKEGARLKTPNVDTSKQPYASNLE